MPFLTLLLLDTQIPTYDEPAVWPVGFTVTAMMAIPVVLAGIVGVIVTAIVAHGILRPLLEARGIAPWRFRDSLGSTPLVTLGSGMTSAAVMALALMAVAATLAGVNALWWIRVLCLALLAAGVLTLRLGLLALRKLT